MELGSAGADSVENAILVPGDESVTGISEGECGDRNTTPRAAVAAK
jgi:hypothetical protein